MNSDQYVVLAYTVGLVLMWGYALRLCLLRYALRRKLRSTDA